MWEESQDKQFFLEIHKIRVLHCSKKWSFNDTVKFISEVFYRAKREHVKIAKKVLTMTEKHRGDIIEDAQYRYCVKGQGVTTLGRNGLRSYPGLAGEWLKRNGERGNDIFSLVKSVKGCADHVTAFLEVAKMLEIDSRTRNKPQICSHKDTEMITEAHAYSPLENSIERERLWGYFGDKYCFKTEQGLESFWLFKWKVEYGQVQLFHTLQQPKGEGSCWWEPIAAPYERILYNIDLIYKYPQKDLHIHDDIARADLSNSGTSIGTWSGDISHYQLIDWSIIAGRVCDVKYIFDQENPESYLIGFHLLNKMQQLGITLEFHPDRGQKNSMSLKYRCTGARLEQKKINSRLTEEEFFTLARERHCIELQPAVAKESDMKDKLCSPSQLRREIQSSEKRSRYLIEGLLWASSLTILTGSAGVGKSLFSLDLAVAIAGGQQFLNHFNIPEPKRVLYIDAENNPEDIDERFQSFKAGSDYDSDLLDKNLGIYSLIHKGKQIDLTVAKDRDRLKKLSKDFDLIIFDNLGKLASPKLEKNIESWRGASDFFIELTREKKAVLVIHHETKQGEYRGTAKIVDDTHAWISLEKSDNSVAGRACFKVMLQKERPLASQPFKSFFVKYITKDGATSRLISFLEEPISDEQKEDRSRNSVNDINDYSPKELERAILKVCRNLEGPFKRKMLIKGLLDPINGYLFTKNPKFEKDVSNRLTTLVKKGVLEIQGETSSSKTYTVVLKLSDDD